MKDFWKVDDEIKKELFGKYADQQTLEIIEKVDPGLVKDFGKKRVTGIEDDEIKKELLVKYTDQASNGNISEGLILD